MNPVCGDLMCDQQDRLAPSRRGYGRNGLRRTVRSLGELAHALGVMHDPTFHHHVRKKRNDFARWVEEVLMDKKLARELREITDRRLAKALVDFRLVWLDVKAYEME